MWTEISRRKIIKYNKIKKEVKKTDAELEEVVMICLAARAKVSKRERRLGGGEQIKRERMCRCRC